MYNIYIYITVNYIDYTMHLSLHDKTLNFSKVPDMPRRQKPTCQTPKMSNACNLSQATYMLVQHPT